MFLASFSLTTTGSAAGPMSNSGIADTSATNITSEDTGE